MSTAKINSLKEGISDYIPRGGMFRNADNKPIGAYVGQGTKDQMKKAKIIAMVKSYEAEPGKRFMAGRVSKEDLEHYDDYARKYEEYFGEIVDENCGKKKSLQESLEDFETDDSEITAFIEEVPVEEVPAVNENPEDTVSMNIPLLMRMLEFAKEDAKTDIDLHDVVEKLTELSKDGRVLTMDDYDSIVSCCEPDEEISHKEQEDEEPVEYDNPMSDESVSDEEWLKSFGW